MPLFEYRDGGAAGDAVVATSCARSATTSSPAASHSSSATGRCRGARRGPSGWRLARRHRARRAGSCSARCRTPAQYAETWARDGGHHPGTADFDAMYAAWLDDFAARDVEAIGFGIVTLHRPREEREVCSST